VAEVSGPVQEKVAAFGEERGLVGILTLPSGQRIAGAPQVILLSTGIIHRVGSNRLWVSLARALGAAGITTLRFDLSGIGDSERRRDVGSLRESVERDIADAIGYLSTTQGAERAVLVGLCSGAYDAFHAALSERRVVGAMMIDMPGPFQTRRHVVHHLWGRLMRPASWRGPVQKALHYSRLLLSASPATRDDGEGYIIGARSRATRERMRDELDALLSRQVELCFVFTPGIETNYNHRSQFRTTFRRAARHPALSYHYFPDADHVFSSRLARARLISLILQWVLERPIRDVG
jgi:pimeloyl-ACP methyl ester carboxylesterase